VSIPTACSGFVGISDRTQTKGLVLGLLSGLLNAHKGSNFFRLEEGQHWFYWFPPHITLSLLQWYNLCLSYNSDTNDMISVLDGHVIAKFNNRDFVEAPTVIDEYGFNCVYGSNPTWYGIRASFADFQIADFALSTEEMERITTCLEHFEGLSELMKDYGNSHHCVFGGQEMCLNGAKRMS
jgi:hypothetical protein